MGSVMIRFHDPCLMAVTFNQKYDIVWAALNSQP